MPSFTPRRSAPPAATCEGGLHCHARQLVQSVRGRRWSQAKQGQAHTLYQHAPWPAFPTTAVGSPISFKRLQMSSCTASRGTHEACIRSMMICVECLTSCRQPVKSHSLTRLGHPRENGLEIKLRVQDKRAYKSTCKQDLRAGNCRRVHTYSSRGAAGRDMYPLRARPREGAALQVNGAHTCTQDTTGS